MTSPLVRTWLAQRLPDWADHAYAIWRGLLHALGVSTEWDPLELADCYKLPAPVSAMTVAAGPPGAAVTPPGPPSPALHLPGPDLTVRPDRSNDAHGAPQGSTETSPCKSGHGIRAGEPTFHTLMPCPVCKVSVGKDCVTRFGGVTGPHRARREAAARQTAAES